MTKPRRALVGVVGIAFLAAAAFAVANGGSSGGERAGFGWLRPAALPAGWSARRLPASPARLPVPPGWRPAHGDAGTRTAVLRGRSGRIVGYLNATPRQGKETLADWSSFRVDHNRDEGDRDVRRLAAAAGLRFRSATGSCVGDTYSTSSGQRYREVACLVSGRTASTVIVAAAPPSRWRGMAPVLERAVDGFTT